MSKSTSTKTGTSARGAKAAERAPRTTSPAVAAQASEILSDPEAGEREKSVAASALSQAEVNHPESADLRSQLLLRRLVQAMDELMAHSQGVYGLHANGDFAPWPTLGRGGEFPGWLDDLDRARDFLAGAS